MPTGFSLAACERQDKHTRARLLGDDDSCFRGNGQRLVRPFGLWENHADARRKAARWGINQHSEGNRPREFHLRRVLARPRMCHPTRPRRCPRCTVTQVELSGSDVLCGSNVGARSEGVTMVSGNSSASPSGRLTASEWAAIVSSLALSRSGSEFRLPEVRCCGNLAGDAAPSSTPMQGRDCQTGRRR